MNGTMWGPTTKLVQFAVGEFYGFWYIELYAIVNGGCKPMTGGTHLVTPKKIESYCSSFSLVKLSNISIEIIVYTA